jgi:long-subunit acyl-CoA synthetase (AMP-forming)
MNKFSIKASARAGTEEAGPCPAHAKTLLEVLLHHAGATPDRPHIYLSKDEGEEQILTCRELLDGATAVARGLVEQGASGESNGWNYASYRSRLP